MNRFPVPPCADDEPVAAAAGDLAAQVRETHTGVVVLLGDRAYKAKKPVVTDFLDFSTTASRERACQHEVALNRRLAPDSYLGVAHVTDPQGGPAEPVIVMRRHADADRLSTRVKSGAPVHEQLRAIATVLARFHSVAERGPAIDTQGTADAVWARWQQNLRELEGYSDVVAPDAVRDAARMAGRFVAGREPLFTRRIAERHILDGHADLLADDIFCLPDGPALLDCLEFDDRLRHVDGIDDAAFLAMDLEFLGRKDLADFFLEEYMRCSGDPAPRVLADFYVAYRAVVRAKVDCVRVTQGHREASDDARRHLDIALEHLSAGTVRLIIVGGGPGSGKTTLSKALAAEIGATVISTDDVRRQLQAEGVVSGAAGELNAGLYSPSNVALVYDEVLRRARESLGGGHSVVLDGTWREAQQRDRAHELGRQASVPVVELRCSVPVSEAAARVGHRPRSNSDATPDIATALGDAGAAGREAHVIDTGRPLADSVAEARRLCRLAT
ncbi:bifunctional aminoglycoside phosphotransferase/ATP-binding protein [Mycolicibacterium pyrenivorans]|uniref:bifunctional aminoglycoside phosphotransferase/ATP-binding protein n=1 Tax=Mycolicibacterium pyrenivorans TaxID=187102 RepID=UPI0021F27AD8|nr:AAA family ATPase [Mycolicibacterium pyrenivorans]MCV7151342.1 AAA family ATPase [Mycolicibacterium pyrenivorans]